MNAINVKGEAIRMKMQENPCADQSTAQAQDDCWGTYSAPYIPLLERALVAHSTLAHGA